MKKGRHNGVPRWLIAYWRLIPIGQRALQILDGNLILHEVGDRMGNLALDLPTIGTINRLPETLLGAIRDVPGTIEVMALVEFVNRIRNALAVLTDDELRQEGDGIANVLPMNDTIGIGEHFILTHENAGIVDFANGAGHNVCFLCCGCLSI